MKSRRGIEGNVLFLILIAVALFAGLSFVIIQSSRSGGSDSTREKARLTAADMLNQATSIQTSITRLIMRGCKAEQLSFESDLDTDHVNPNAPPDKSCHIFDAAGGGAIARTIDKNSANDPRYFLVGSAAVSGIGSTCAEASCADLALQVRGVTPALCEQVNFLNGLLTNFAQTPAATQASCPFKGSFDCNGNGVTDVAFAAPPLTGKTTFCYIDATHGPTYSHVVLIR